MGARLRAINDEAARKRLSPPPDNEFPFDPPSFPDWTDFHTDIVGDVAQTSPPVWSIHFGIGVLLMASLHDGRGDLRRSQCDSESEVRLYGTILTAL